MRKLLSIVCIAAVLSFGAGCGGGGGGGGGGRAVDGEQSVGQSGGTVTKSEGETAGTEVSVPPGALDDPVVITIDDGPEIETGGTLPAGPVVDLGPDGQQFAAPVEVVVPYDPAEIPDGQTAADLVVLKYDGLNDRYIILTPVAVDTDNLTLTVETTSFSSFQSIHPSAIDPDASTLTASPLSGLAADSVERTTITVTIVNRAGNPLPGHKVDFIVSGSGNVLDIPDDRTNGNGVVVAYLSSSVAETKTVTVNVHTGNGNPIAVTSQISVTFDTWYPPFSTGSWHTLQVQNDRTVVAWGSNHDLQLGQSQSLNESTLPLTVTGLANVADVSAGERHSLALLLDGTVWSWGDNNYGQLGDGTRTDRHTPAQVPGLSNVVKIYAGYYHSLALKQDGTVWAWGENGDGQCGQSPQFSIDTPTEISSLSNVTDICAGFDHSLAVASGTVYSWGANLYGQLGDGTQTARSVPTVLAIPGTVTQVEVGMATSLALLDNGTVYSWGRGAQGALGHGNQIDTYNPTLIQGLTDVAEIACSWSISLARLNSGTLKGWGGSASGGTGTGTNQNDLVPTDVLYITSAASLKAGRTFAICRESNGQMWAFGSNNHGQFGNGTTEFANLTPVRINGPSVRLVVQQDGPSFVSAGDLLVPKPNVAIADKYGVVNTAATDAIAASLFGGDPTATLNGTTQLDAANGEAEFTDLSVVELGSDYELKFEAEQLSPARSQTFDVRPGPASQLVFNVQPTDTVAGQAIAPVIEVHAVDTYGNIDIVYNGTVTLALENNPTGGTLSGAVSTQVVSGIATFSNVGIEKAGTGYTLSATSNTLNVESSQFNVTPDQATSVIFLTQPTDSTAGDVVSSGLQVAIQDQYANTITSSTDVVTLALNNNPGSATLLGTLQRPAIAGIATFDDISIQVAASGYTLGATAATYMPDQSQAFDIFPGAATALAFVQQPTGGTVFVNLTPHPSVAIVDLYGNTVTGSTAPVTISLSANPGGATLSGTTSVSATAGESAFSDLSLDKRGTGYQFNASSPSLGSVASNLFDVAGAPVSVEITQHPTDVLEGDSIAPAIRVRVLDDIGVQVTNYASPITLQLIQNPGSATLGGTTSVTPQGGEATFSDISLDKAGVGFQLRATSGSLLEDDSQTFRVFGISEPVAFREGWQFPNKTQVNVTMGFFTLELVNFAGDHITSDNSTVVSLALASGTGTVSGTLNQTAITGIAVFDDLSYDTVESITLQATTNGYPAVTSGPISVEAPPADATSLELVGQASDGTPGDGNTERFELSCDGRYVLFSDSSDNLHPPLQGGSIYLRDRVLSETRIISKDRFGQPTYASGGLQISADGRYMFFKGGERDFVENDTNGAYDLFVYDAARDKIQKITQSYLGGEADGFTQYGNNAVGEPRISSSGRFVVYSAYYSNLVPNDTNQENDIYLTDMALGTTIRISVTSSGQQTSGKTEDPDVSDDGNVIVFRTQSGVFSSQDQNGTFDVYVHERSTGATSLMSKNFVTGAATGNTGVAAISRDGNVILTAGPDEWDPTDQNGEDDTYLMFWRSGTIERVSISELGVNEDGPSWPMDASDDLRFIIFLSTTTNLVANDNNGARDVFIRDRVAGLTYLFSQDASGGQTSEFIGAGRISGDGRFAAFRSNGTNFVVPDTNNDTDVFLGPVTAGTPAPAISAANSSVSLSRASMPVSSGSEKATVSLVIRDTTGQPINGATCQVIVYRGTTQIFTSTVQSNGSGQASSQFSSTLSGEHRVTVLVQDGALNIELNEHPTMEVTPGPVASLQLINQPPDGSAQVPLPSDVRVRALDAFSNLVTSPGGSMTASLITNPTGAALSGTLSSSITGGVAGFDNLELDLAGNGYQLRFNYSGITVDSGTFNVGAAPSGMLRFTSTISDTLVGQSIANVQVEITDVDGNRLNDSSSVVTLSTVSGASLTGTTSVTASQGLVNFDNVQLDSVRKGLTLRATLSGFTVAHSSPFNVGRSQVNTIEFSIQPTMAEPGEVMTQVEVRLIDAFSETALLSTDPVTLSFGANPGGGQLGGTLTVHPIDGIAKFSDLTIPTVGIGYTLVASAGSATPVASDPFDIAASYVAAGLAFDTQPEELVENQIQNRIDVIVVDRFGNRIYDATNTVQLTLATNPGSATLSGTIQIAAERGMASFPSAIVDTIADGYVLGAESPGLISTTSSTFHCVPNRATSTFTITPGSGVIANGTDTYQIDITIRDTFGNPVPNQPFFIECNSSGVTISQPSSTDANGQSTGHIFSTVSGSKSFTVFRDIFQHRWTLNQNGGVTFDVTGPSKLQFQNGVSANYEGFEIDPRLRVEFADDNGNRVTTVNDPITISLGTAPAGATLSGTTTRNAVNGFVEFGGLRIDKEGTYTLKVTATGVTMAETNAFPVLKGPAGIEFFEEPTDAGSGEIIRPFVKVRYVDENGDAFTNANNYGERIEIALLNNPTSTSLIGNLSETPSQGVSTFQNLRINASGTGYTLRATAFGFPPVDSQAFDVLPGDPDAGQSSLSASPDNNLVPDGSDASTLTVTVRDSIGNPVPGVSVEFQATGLGNQITQPTGLTDANGQATGALVSTEAGAKIVSAVVDPQGIAVTVSQQPTVTFVAGPPAAIDFGFLPSASETAGGPWSFFTVEIQDAAGARIADDNTTTVTVSVTTGSGTLAGTTTVTAINGIAIFDDLSYGNAESIVLNFSSNPSTNTLNSSTIQVDIADNATLPMTRLTVDTNGGDPDREAHPLSTSHFGRWGVFVSDATDLILNDTNGRNDIFARDLFTGTTDRISELADGTEVSWSVSDTAISANGRYIAFEQNASSNFSYDTNGKPDIYVWDRRDGSFSRVSVSSDGVQGDGYSWHPKISASGRYVLFGSTSTNLISGDTNGVNDAYLRDRALGTTDRVSLTNAGGQISTLTGSNAILSRNGRMVLFHNGSDGVVPGDDNGRHDLFLRDLDAGTTELISWTSNNTLSTTSSGVAVGHISDDGRYVIFESEATDMVPNDTNGESDIFLRDRVAGTTVRVSLNENGWELSGRSHHSDISPDGRYVIFTTPASDVVASDTNGVDDVFIKDLVTGQVQLISVAHNGTSADGASESTGFSGDGNRILFRSGASNLLPGMTNAGLEAFMVDNPLK